MKRLRRLLKNIVCVFVLLVICIGVAAEEPAETVLTVGQVAGKGPNLLMADFDESHATITIEPAPLEKQGNIRGDVRQLEGGHNCGGRAGSE